MTAEIFKIGTRGSPLALKQANMCKVLLETTHPVLAGRIEIVPMTTTGDKILDRPLYDAGGKGLFTKEIEDALLANSVDIAVHSMKDMPTVLPPGLVIGAVLEREDPRDAFFSPHSDTIEGLKKGAIIGTASLRRQAILKAMRPDFIVEILRGNVGTRLKKLAVGEVDATLLAVAGLKRLGLEHQIQTILEPEVMLPAVGQGVIGIECRASDEKTRALLQAIHCEKTSLRLTAERAFLAVMDGSCRTPIAALASEGESMTLRVLVARPDGTDLRKDSVTGIIKTEAQAEALGRDIGQKMRQGLPPGFFNE